MANIINSPLVDLVSLQMHKEKPPQWNACLGGAGVEWDNGMVFVLGGPTQPEMGGR